MAYKPSKVAKRFEWKPATVRKEISRLKNSGFLRQNPDNSYVIALREDLKQKTTVAKSVAKIRGTTEISKRQIQFKSHDIAIENIDLSGYIEFLKKFNMLKPVGRDNAQNVGLRPGLASKFAMRVCLRNPRKSSVYPISKGWQDELRYVFNDDPNIIDKIYSKDTREKVALALEWDSIKDHPLFLGKKFKDLKGMMIQGPDGYFELCESQFVDGELCVHGNSKKDTENIVQELMGGVLERASTLKIIEENVARMPFVIMQIVGDQISTGIKDALKVALSDGIQEAVKLGVQQGMEEAFKKNEYKPSQKKGIEFQ